MSQQLVNYASYASLAGLVLTIVALAIAGWQVWSARKLSDSLSTKFLGTFPDYLPRLAQLLRQARTRIDICTGIPVQGVFSDPASWLECQHAIKEKSHKIPVSIVVPDKLHRDQITQKQYENRRDDEAWAKWRKEKAKELSALVHFNAPHLNPETITFDEFISVLTERQDGLIHKEFQGIEVIQCAALITTFFWIIDDREAIIAFLTLSSKAVVHGFHTNDGTLISALLGVKKQYYDKFMVDSKLRVLDSVEPMASSGRLAPHT